MKKKIALMVTSLVLVVAMAVGGTLAYLTAETAAVENTFTVGNIEITLDETKIVNGQAYEERWAEGNTYKVYPGAVVDKDPIVHVVANSEPCYVYVCIDNQVNEKVANAATCNVGTDWAEVGSADGKTVYKYNDVVATSSVEQDLTVFTEVTFAGTLTNEDTQSLANTTISVSAYAHQATDIDGTDVDALAKAHFGIA